MNKQRIIVLAAAGVGLLSCILPWASINVFFIKTSVSGLGVWSGWLTFLGFVLAGVFGFLGDDRNQPVEKSKRVFITIGGAVAFLFALLTMVIWATSDGSAMMSFGIGMYLALLSGIALAAIPFVIKDDGGFEMPTKEAVMEDLKEMKEDVVEEVKEMKDEVKDKIDGEEE
ncbi:MAG: hypothetical protein ACWA41_08475 [Putridiphycobacter sp.]